MPATIRSPTTLDKRNHPSARHMRHLRAEANLHGVQGLDQGRVEVGKSNNLYVGCRRPPPRADTSMWPVRHCSHWQLPRSTIEGEDRRRGDEGCGAVMREMWRNGHPLYASRDP